MHRTRASLLAAALLAALLAGGCGATPEYGWPSPKTHFIHPKMAEIAYLPELLPDDSDASPPEWPSYDASKVVVVGYLSTARRFDAEKAADAYELYMQGFANWELDRPPSYSQQEFEAGIGGFTKIKLAGIPGFSGQYATALVPNSLMDELGFESAFSTYMWGDAADLVVARTNADGALIIAGLLCKEWGNDEFGECKSQYRRGIYHSETGIEINTRRQLGDDAGQIDPETFKRVK